jgi:H+/gluconate symporter-like permease
MRLRSLLSSAGSWVGARRRALPGAPEIELAPLILLVVLLVVGLYFVIPRFERLLSSPRVTLSSLEIAGVMVVATGAGFAYSRVVAWLDRNE